MILDSTRKCWKEFFLFPCNDQISVTYNKYHKHHLVSCFLLFLLSRIAAPLMVFSAVNGPVSAVSEQS